MANGRAGALRRRVTAMAAGSAALAVALVPGAGVAGAAPAAPAPEVSTLAISAAPATGLADGQAVDVTIDGSAAPVILVQCDPSVLATPDLGGLLRLCDNPLTVDRTLRPVTVEYPVVEQLVSWEGVPVACGDCLIVATSLGGRGFVSAPISVVPGPPGPLGVRAQPSVDLEPTTVAAQVWGGRTSTVAVAQCRAGVTTVADLATGPCTPTLGTVPAGRAPDHVDGPLAYSFVGNDGSPVDCQAAPGTCVIAAGEPGGTLATGPLAFRNGVVVWAWRPLHTFAGTAMGAGARGLAPGASYSVVRCASASPRSLDDCEDAGTAPSAVADAAGELSVPLTAPDTLTLRDGRTAYCRDDCAVALVRDGQLIGAGSFGLTVGALAASPATGLTDGQVVGLTGTNLTSSYTGAPYWAFPSTGGWALAQCAGDVLDSEPTIVSVFAACTALPVDGSVPLTSLDVDVPVAASFTPILGGTVDCTAAPGACALVLTRVEEGGWVSLHGTRVSFA